MSAKVFVGNLAFRTTDNALKELFAEQGNVNRAYLCSLKASIITRGHRALGYGFVDFETLEDAQKAVDNLHGTELYDRKIKVEMANDPAHDRKKRQKKRNNRRARKAQAKAQEEAEKAEAAGKEGGEKEGETPKEPKKKANRRKKRQKEKRPAVDSETTVFVANLPFSIDDETLLDVNAVSAHVVRTPNKRSRGYGFVEFENKEAQLAGIEAKNGLEVEGENGNRTISVSVSTSTAQAKDEKDEAAPKETTADQTTEKKKEESADDNKAKESKAEGE